MRGEGSVGERFDILNPLKNMRNIELEEGVLKFEVVVGVIFCLNKKFGNCGEGVGV
jgi:hypothetical protein